MRITFRWATVCAAMVIGAIGLGAGQSGRDRQPEPAPGVEVQEMRSEADVQAARLEIEAEFWRREIASLKSDLRDFGRKDGELDTVRRIEAEVTAGVLKRSYEALQDVQLRQRLASPPPRKVRKNIEDLKRTDAPDKAK